MFPNYFSRRGSMKNFQIDLLFSLLILFPSIAFSQNDITPGEFIVEPPTIECAGFEWSVDGDNNRNSTVDVTYRKKGDVTWKKALPLLHIGGEHIVHEVVAVDYTAPNMFAGSIFDLEQGTEYECRFEMNDPDGITGNAVRTVTVKTRQVPKVHTDGRVLHVYPPDYKGQKVEPSFVGLMHAYYGPGRSLWGSGGEHGARPGDIILIHGGTYKSDRLTYYEPLWMHFHGAYTLTKSGTPEQTHRHSGGRGR